MAPKYTCSLPPWIAGSTIRQSRDVWSETESSVNFTQPLLCRRGSRRFPNGRHCWLPSGQFHHPGRSLSINSSHPTVASRTPGASCVPAPGGQRRQVLALVVPVSVLVNALLISLLSMNPKNVPCVSAQRGRQLACTIALQAVRAFAHNALHLGATAAHSPRASPHPLVTMNPQADEL